MEQAGVNVGLWIRNCRQNC